MRRRGAVSSGSPPAARRLHGRPRLHEAVGADDAGLQGGGWLEDRAAERSPAEGPVVGDLRRSRAPRAGGGGGGGQPESEDRRGPAARGPGLGPFQPGRAVSHDLDQRRASSVRESGNRPFLPPSASTGSSGDVLLSLDMSYEIDLWGRVRRTVAAARHEAQATAADLETARLSLQAELAIDYFELRAADAAAAAPGRDGESLRGGAPAHDESLRGRRRAEVRRRPGPDAARHHARRRPPTSPCSGRSSSTRSRR